jgi:phospholipid-translocating ATPase
LIPWNKEASEAFELLKLKLCDQPVLNSPQWDKPFILTTDACDHGCGAILSQLDEQGNERPLAYFSKKLNKHERNYSITEKEGVAIIRGIGHFKHYLECAKFLIKTDHRALTFIKDKQTESQRLARWALFLQTFDFSIEYVKGKDIPHVDAMSRMIGNAI